MGLFTLKKYLLSSPTPLPPLPALTSMTRYIHCVHQRANGFSSGARHAIQAPAHHTTLAQFWSLPLG